MSLLTEQEITEIVREAARGSATRRDGSTSQRIARAIESLVIEQIKAQGGVVRRITTQDSMTGEITMNEEILYRLPEGD